MDDPAFKAKYHKYKTKVKLWEKSFKELNGRVPSKYDIREAPSAIRDSYKMYYKLKTTFLEEALSDALDEDSFDLSILESSSQTDPRLSGSFTDMSTPDVSALTSETSIILQNSNSEKQLHSSNPTNISNSYYEPNAKEFEAESTTTLNDNAWKSTIKTTTSTNNDTTNTNDKLRKSVSAKLFRNSSFIKRNPRKSLSRNSLTSSQSSQSTLASVRKESFPDLETILSQKSKQQKENEESEEQPVMPLDVIKTMTPNLATINIDEEWLNRCNKANSIGDDTNVTHIASNESRSKTIDNPKTFGISNINVAALANLERNSQTVQEVSAKTMLSFDMGNLNLTAQNSLIGMAPIQSDVIPCTDDEIANSEDESEMNTSRQIRSIRQSSKRKRNEIDRDIPAKLAATNNNSDHVPTKPQPLTVRKTKSSTKLQPRAEVKVVPKSKSEPKVKPLPKTISEDENVNVEIVTRKSSRNANKTKTYKEQQASDLISDQDEEEIDPYAGDDSDNDPNFAISQSPKSKRHTNGLSSDSSNDEQPKVNEETAAPNRRKRVARIKAPPKPRVKAERKVAVPRKMKPVIKTGPNSSIDESETPQETPDDYLIEFGMENIKSVPRIPVTELQQNTMEFSKYVYSTTSTDKPNETASGATKSKPLTTKNAIARDKLQSKIAAGSLNENYVRLNLRKKVFVRGKKTMNFSRYKKKLWRGKKAAALSGPDMDMGGCDGGILTCFQCGLPGHFAQNCKIKSDRLLPVTAEEESPFPTLQEVEEMSNQQIKLAHVHRVLPKVDNPTWKTDSDELSQEVETATPTSSTVADELIPSESGTDDLPDLTPTPIPTPTPTPTPTQSYIGHQIPEDFLKKAGLVGNETDDANYVEPLYKLNDDGSVPETPAEVYEALAMFGHKQFRSGQERAVMRILSGQSTLVTLSTGSGKSLCYQLPAYLYSRRKRCITLVISPLVSLMEDQVQGVPHFLNAQCLHTNLSEQKRTATLELIKAGKVDVLLISPEAVVSSEKSTGFGSILRDLPPVAFVCIDECHCVSQFGHNFRPSYLMVCRVLYEKLKVKRVLGLTATATISTRLSIVEHLRIPDGLNGVISDIPLPDNLTLSISCDDNRDIALVQLLREPRFVEYQSIIIYCSRRDECERVAKNLRTYFQDNIARELELRNSTGKRRRALKTTIEPYHAGMAGSRRRTIQNAFMRGDLKIVVATIAFGMGINKADIRCVIHYNMPMNFESYVQEVGRAGRDGKPAHCHLFLDSKGEDKVELRRHIYANSIDRHIIRRLLHKIFIPCACKKPDQVALKSNSENTVDNDIDAAQGIDWNDEMPEGTSTNMPANRSCPGHEVCFSVDETINELDIPEENISTLLCYLELHDQRYVKALSKAYIRCKVLSYGGSKALKNAAQKCPPLAMAIALDIRKGISHDNSTFIEFPVVEIASAIGWNSGVVKYQLKQLEWTTENGHSRRSNISVEFFDLGFRVLAPGDLSATELDETLNMLYSRVQEQETNQISQLENVFRGLTSVAVKSSLACAAVEPNNERSERLKMIVRKYFQSNEMLQYSESASEPVCDPVIDDIITSDIYTMISRYPENNFTGRSLARIFHGVQSPVFPAVIWSRCKYWRAHLKTDFNHIVKLANAVILKLRT